MIIADAHAHFYPCYHPDLFFTSAFENFQKAEKTQGVRNSSAVMFVTDLATTSGFELLRSGKIKFGGAEQTRRWTVSSTDESCSLRINHLLYPARELFLISGYQLVTAERLEVLAIGCNHHPDNGMPITDMLTSLFKDGGLVILPWGVGKWLGKRGRIIEETIAGNSNPLLFLGDNGNRPGFWPVSSLKPCRRSDHSRLLSGTDPLPLTGEETRVGTFGSIIHADIDPQTPFKTLKKTLSLPETMITSYGDLQASLSFIKQQVALRRNR